MNPVDELQPLLNALFEDAITAEQHARLEQLVLEHPEAAEHYVRFMNFHADMIEHLAGLPAPKLDAPAPKATPSTMEKPKMRSTSKRWKIGIAASVLLAIGIYSSTEYFDWRGRSRAVADAQSALEQNRAELARLQAERQAKEDAARIALQPARNAEQAIANEYQSAIQAARTAIESKDFTVRLTGPTHAEPGAPNKWQVETLRHGAVGRPRSMDLVVKDAKDVELLRQSHDKPVGAAMLELPPGFWEKVKPGSDLFLEVSTKSDDGRTNVLADRIPLARPVYVTHLVTDKPLYKPGEMIRFRSLTLDRATLKPPTHDLHMKFRLRDPADAAVPIGEGNGRLLKDLQLVNGPDGQPLRGIGVGEYALPADAPGGEYKLDLIEVMNNKDLMIETRKLIVNRYVPDTFEKKLEFDGKSYGAGGFVQARIEVSRTAGGPMKDAIATVTASVDGREIHRQNGAKFSLIGTKAGLNVGFKLPADLTSTNAVLSVAIQDGGDIETILRPIPIVSKSLRVEFFPEGGEMIAGVPGRVYIQVRTPAGKPADLKGYITDGVEKLADVETATDAEHEGVNRGHGAFRFTPKVGTEYFLKLTSPSGIVEPTKNGFPLPAAVADGIAMESLDAATAKGAPIRVRLQSASAKSLHVGAYARGRLIAHRKVEIEANKPVDVALAGEDTAGGVTRVTVFENRATDGKPVLVPRAERLVYRVPAEQLILGANPDKARYSPGDKVKLELTAMNENRDATPAIVLVGVVNRSVVSMADNKNDRLLPTHFLLSGDVKHGAELEHADFLLTDHPQAAPSLDRLLATQGWRRFAEQNGRSTDPADRVEVEHMLTAHGQRSSAPLELFKLEEQRVTADFQPKIEQARIRVLREQTQSQTANAVLSNDYIAAAAAVTRSESNLRAASEELDRFKSTVRSWIDRLEMPLLLLPFVGLLVFLFAMAVMTRSPAKRGSYIAGAAAVTFCGLIGLSMIGGKLSKQESLTFSFVGSSIQPPASATRDFAPAAPAERFRGSGFNGGGFAAGPEPIADARPTTVPALPPPPPKAKTDPKPKTDSMVNNADPLVVNPLRGQSLSRDMYRQSSREAENLRSVTAGASIPFFVREYAHERDPALGDVRADFTETVYWQPVLVLPNSGKATVEFQLSDDIARYQVLVAGHTTDGRIGAVLHTIEARKPFSIDPKLPLEISHTDMIDMPVRATNDTDVKRPVGFTLAANGLKDDGRVHAPFDLAPNGKGRRLIRMAPDKLEGDATVLVTGSSNAADKDTIARGSITLPKEVVPGSLRVRLEVYPTSLSDLVKGLDGLLREPYGCFEQTSTSNYPNTMILDYLNQSNQVNPAASAKAKGFLDKGYARLTSFECPDTPGRTKHGFEWFGAADRQHEALTAYGLLQFKDMARVHPVDPELIKRTQAFLMSRKDGKGGFKQTRAGYHSWGAVPHVVNAYIVWALVESDPDDAEKLDLKLEIATLKAAALNAAEKDAYFIALVANILLQRGEREAAHMLLDRLQEKHLKDGAVTGAVTSVTQSGGRDLLIETTALSLLGWLRANDPKYQPAVKECTKWISQQRGGYGGFGSTQSTILTLKALTLHAKKYARPAESGSIQVMVGGRVIATRNFTQEDVEVIGLDIPNPEAFFQPGRNEVEIVTDAKQAYPFALSHTYTTLTPVSAPECSVKIATKLGKAEAIEGETVPLTVSLENLRKKGHGMAVAIVGLPAGMKVPTDMKQLTALREQEQISYFEIRGRELILYWRELAPEQKIDLTVDLVCELPGEYRGPASRGYLYYDADPKHWVEPLQILIKAQSE